jgi:hypothetical protein
VSVLWEKEAQGLGNDMCSVAYMYPMSLASVKHRWVEIDPAGMTATTII